MRNLYTILHIIYLNNCILLHFVKTIHCQATIWSCYQRGEHPIVFAGITNGLLLRAKNFQIAFAFSTMQNFAFLAIQGLLKCDKMNDYSVRESRISQCVPSAGFEHGYPMRSLAMVSFLER